MKLNNYPDIVSNYIQKKGFINWQLEWDFKCGIENVVVVPSICEYENIQRLLASLIPNDHSHLKKTLVIFVINHSASSSSEIKEDNKISLHFLRGVINKNNADKFTSNILNSGINIGLIDAATESLEFNSKEAGVGLARKIGMDKALEVFDYSKETKKIIICVDADCIVERNYLNEINKSFNNFNLSIATVDFEHDLSTSEMNNSGILAYQIFLRHYVSGLLFANSPFAYHTIGSTIVCDHEAYIKVGGMNTKAAAEDFYFLQKLAKLYNIAKIDSTVVEPSSRESWRVPFGTGRSMMDYNSNRKNILVYDPDEYVILKKWLNLLNSDLVLNTELVLKEAKKIHIDLLNFLEAKGFRKDWNQILSNSRSEKQLDYQRKNWFDAFKTLKLIHHLRDTSFPMLNLKSGVEKFFKIVEHPLEKEFEVDISNIQSQNLYFLSKLKHLENSLGKNLTKHLALNDN